MIVFILLLAYLVITSISFMGFGLSAMVLKGGFGGDVVAMFYGFASFLFGVLGGFLAFKTIVVYFQ